MNENSAPSERLFTSATDALTSFIRLLMTALPIMAASKTTQTVCLERVEIPSVPDPFMVVLNTCALYWESDDREALSTG